MPSMKPPELFAQIDKGAFSPAYLLSGEETYFIDRALTKLVDKAMKGAPRDFNLDVFYGKDAKADEVAGQAATLPMMADRRVVVLKEADRLKDIGPIKAYMESPCPETVLILVAANADKAKERILSDALKNGGALVHFYHPFDSELNRWTKLLAKEAGYGIDEKAADYLKDVLEGNLALIESELNKVYNFIGERKTVTLEDVKESVGDFGLPLVFDLIDATAGKKPAKALEILAKLLRDGEQPLMLLGMMASQWRKLLTAKEMAAAGESEEQISKVMKLNFANKKSFLWQLKGQSLQELERAFGHFRKADSALKGSALAPGMVIEQLVLELSGAKAARSGRK
jgi:DNA polymerase III subunit delta